MSRRLEELAANLDAVRARIRAACSAAGRDPAEVRLIAVTKTRPASDVRSLRELGVTDFGENRDAEAAAKAAACADLDLTWHFVGQLQTRKCRGVAGYADVIHSVDRLRLVRALGAAARRAGREPRCLVQVNLDPPVPGAAGPEPGPAHRGGVRPGAALELAAELDREPGLALAGVMAVAPLPGHGPGTDPAAAFAVLARTAARIRAGNPAATVISAGMSGDLEAAIGAGATHVRIGTALLGDRGPLVM